MVNHKGIIDAFERLLAVLSGTAENAVGVAVFGAVVLGEADVHPVSFVELLVNLENVVEESIRRRNWQKQIAASISRHRIAAIGFRLEAQNLFRNRVDAIGRNDVVGERIAPPPGAVESARPVNGS